jgi:tRNA(fMet)-specific endonuclease VapC
VHLLDTDTLTHLLAGRAAVVRRLSRLEDPEVGTTIVTKIELLRGRFDFLLKAATAQEVLRAQEWLLRTERLLDDILVVPFDSRAAEHFDRLRSTPALRKIGRADLLIASIALGHRATLVTRNIRHFRPVPNLTIENWID